VLGYLLAVLVAGAAIVVVGLVGLSAYRQGKALGRLVGLVGERVEQASAGLTRQLEELQRRAPQGRPATSSPRGPGADGTSLAARVGEGRASRD